MASEGTKNQIREWLQKAVEKAQSSDPREKLKREREQKAKKKEKKYGL